MLSLDPMTNAMKVDAAVQITQVRNATLLLEVGGQKILLDPMLGAKGFMGAVPSTSGNESRNPTVDLGVPLGDLVDPDVVVVTHTHPDHWDAAATALLPRQVPLVVQNTADGETIAAEGFTEVRVLSPSVSVGATSFTRTDGQHGSDEVLATWGAQLGQVSGVVLRHPDEPVVYVVGDSVLNDAVRAALAEYQPDIVVLNTGDARWADGSSILMDADDVLRVHEAAPQARIVTVHMEALNHCVVTRAQVRELVQHHDLAEHVFVPDDGHTLTF